MSGSLGYLPHRDTLNWMLLSLMVACAALAAEPAFEVASVKPNPMKENNSSINTSNGSIRATTTVRRLILMAWDLRDSQVTGGPAWIESERWDVVARSEAPLPRGKEGSETMRAMLRSLLADRFHLQTHMEKRELSVYALVVGKSGFKMKVAPADEGSGSSTGNTKMKFTSISMEMIARTLSNHLGRVVLDETGVTGQYDGEMNFSPEGQPDAEFPSVFTALQEQLGLRLESKKSPVDVLVVDRVERAGEN